MTYTDANGILRWEETDPITPLESTLNAGMDSVSAAITGVKNGIIHYVADTSERAAKALAFAPSNTKPLYVHRGDATSGFNLEYTTNGTTWDTVRGGSMKVRNVTPTAVGVLSTATAPLAAAQTIPANPFGAQPYWLTVTGGAVISCPAPNRGVVETVVDGTVLDYTEISAGSGAAQVRGLCSKGILITNPNTTHTVGVQLRMLEGTGTVLGPGRIYQIELSPAVSF